ncbi:CbaC protein [Natronobeatus ordinarius]|uniref:CbaC protein n=1 Tax=Natronobeatus ordinarius TaxID=2963433 RepID=UPI0020CC22F3|nr:CbaC protein [Natronobeatus ordinarius]
MRISRAKLIVLIALVVVIAVELRTVLAFFDVELSILAVAVGSVVVIVALVSWAVFTTSEPQKPG